MFFELHAGLLREGPGDDASTERALRLLPDLPAHPRILDIGCGPGAQTLVLARATGGTVTAVDVHQPFLDELMQRARAAGLAESIRPLRASMDALPFEPESFDLVWSEGSIYIMGFERGLRAWQPLVRHGGYVVVSELSWLVDDPPNHAREFWKDAYPPMRPVAENTRTVERCGYARVAEFVLPKSGLARRLLRAARVPYGRVRTRSRERSGRTNVRRRRAPRDRALSRARRHLRLRVLPDAPPVTH